MYRHAPAGYDCPFCAVVRGEDNPPWTHTIDDVFPRRHGDGLYGSPHRLTTREEREPYASRLCRSLRL